MRRVVIVLPELLVADRDDSSLRQDLPSMRALTEIGRLSRLAQLPPSETPEAFWLGMRPGEGELRQGPLTVSALGADPPDRSTHFHLSLLGLVDGEAVQPPAVVPAEELRLVLETAKRLNTKSLTMVAGENLDHGLVWEGLGDIHTIPASDVVAESIRSHLPQGDAETILRRYIDDSVNLLTELELNQRRLDEGIPPLNLLWPWGQGVRRPLPNLALRRGAPAWVESASMRLAGLTRLVGYRHGDRASFGHGMNTRFEAILDRALARDLNIAVFTTPSEMRAAGKLEEEHWWTKQLDERFLKPLLDRFLRKELKLALVAPGASGGLSLALESIIATGNNYPFDDRSLNEPKLAAVDAWAAIDDLLMAPAVP